MAIEKKKTTKHDNRGFLILLIFVFLFLIIAGRRLMVVATVNGQAITRAAIVRELEKQGGAEILESLIVKTLIINEAKSLGVTTTDEEIDSEIKIIEEQVIAQGLTLETALTMQGTTINELRENLKIQLMIEKIFENKVEVTDQEVSEYFEQNKTLFGDEATLVDVQEDIRTQILQQKLSQQYQNWITELEAEASIDYWVNY